MPGVRFCEGIDANVELPNLDDGIHTLTGGLCTNHGTTSRALDFLEHMHKHGVRACNTWPTEAHRDHGSSWTCMGTRKELRLIDYICFETALPYQVCYKEDVNTDHRAIHTSIPLAPVGAVTDHVKCFSRKKRRKESLKHWTRSSEAIAEQIRGSIDALSRVTLWDRSTMVWRVLYKTRRQKPRGTQGRSDHQNQRNLSGRSRW